MTQTLEGLGQERTEYLHRAALEAARATLTNSAWEAGRATLTNTAWEPGRATLTTTTLWQDPPSRGLLLLPCLNLISQHLQMR